MGYNAISFSGGEPFLYRDFEKALQLCKALSLKTLVVTNGFFINKKNIDFITTYIDVIAISIDGPENVHNEMRNSNIAFKKATEGIAILKECKIKFGIIHTLTEQTYDHLYWLLEFTKANDAKLLQIHPLEKAGRAIDSSLDTGLDQDSLQRVYSSLFIASQDCNNSFSIQVDLVHKEFFEEDRNFIFQNGNTIDSIPASLQKIIVLQPDGIIVPVSYGFSNKYMIADLNKESLTSGWSRYMNDSYPSFLKLNSELIDKINATSDVSVFNWTEKISEHGLAIN